MTTLWFESALLAQGWARRVRLSVSDGVVTAIETDVEPEPVDERHAIGLPGLSNVHSHAFQRAMAGLAEGDRVGPDSFWGWREVMYQFIDRLLPHHVEAIAALAYLEMLEAGFTRVGEFHYLHHQSDGRRYDNPAEMAEAIAAASSGVGLKLTLLPVFYAYSGFGQAPPSPDQRRFISSRDGFETLLEACRKVVAPLTGGVLGVAPHSLRAVGPDDIAWLDSLQLHAPIHIHISEQMREVDACRAWSGTTPVAWLMDHANIDARWCLVHATHVDQAEIRRIALSQAVVGLCPITEANLGDGVFPATLGPERDWAYGVGTDSNVLIDAAEELRLLEYGQRLTQQARNVLAAPGRTTGRSIFSGALAGGAQAVQGQDGLTVGGPADLFSLDADHPALLGRREDQILDSWIFAAKSGAIDCVWVDGVRKVQGGRHQRRGQIIAAYKSIVAEILE